MMRPFTNLATFDDALNLALALVRPVEQTEAVALREAGDRVLAEDVVAGLDVPGTDRAAMDGYAVRAAELAGTSPDAPVTLPVAQDIYAAAADDGDSVPEGHVARIATGGPIPAGADAVAPVEWTVDRSGTANPVSFTRAPSIGQHITRRASDIAAGASVLERDCLLTPGRIGVLAGVGHAHATVYRRPCVALMTTGDEIVQLGADLRPGQVFDVNSYTLQQVIDRAGGVAMVRPNARDTLDGVTAAITNAVDTGADFVVTVGGASVGEKDLVSRAVEAAGGTIHVHGIAIQPGKPTLIAQLGATVFIGLPGYPASALTLAIKLLAPLIRRAARRPAPPLVQVSARFEGTARSDANRQHFLAVELSGADGTSNGWRAVNVFKGSGAVMSMAHVNGFVEIPIGSGGIDDGTTVTVERISHS